jgi:hypothetical protein
MTQLADLPTAGPIRWRRAGLLLLWVIVVPILGALLLRPHVGPLIERPISGFLAFAGFGYMLSALREVTPAPPLRPRILSGLFAGLVFATFTYALARGWI